MIRDIGIGNALANVALLKRIAFVQINGLRERNHFLNARRAGGLSAHGHAFMHQRRQRHFPAFANRAQTVRVFDADIGEEDFVKLTSA